MENKTSAASKILTIQAIVPFSYSITFLDKDGNKQTEVIKQSELPAFKKKHNLQ